MALFRVHITQNMANGTKQGNTCDPMNAPFWMLVVNITVLEFKKNYSCEIPRLPSVESHTVNVSHKNITCDTAGATIGIRLIHQAGLYPNFERIVR